MNPWLALMIGLWVGFMLGVVAVALAQMAKDKPRPLGYWDGSDEQVVFTPEPAWLDELRRRDGIPTRRGPYDWT